MPPWVVIVVVVVVILSRASWIRDVLKKRR
jgi:hypothetical protein